MGGYIPEFEENTSEGWANRQIMSIQHRHIEEKADGSKKSYERTLDYLNTHVVDGGKWLRPVTPNFFDKDKDSLHRNKKDSALTVTERTTLDDGRGNKTITEDAYKMEDSRIIKGTKLISDKPDLIEDKRGEFLLPFQNAPDIFSMIESKKNQQTLSRG
jgi:hypothetical protein